MKSIVTVIMAALLLTPAIGAAADQKGSQETPAVVSAKASPQKLDLNKASREDLEAVPGIGPRTAQAIVDLRTKKGAFKRVEELLEVTGIKEKKLASIIAYLEVGPPPAAAIPASAKPK